MKQRLNRQLNSRPHEFEAPHLGASESPVTSYHIPITCYCCCCGATTKRVGSCFSSLARSKSESSPHWIPTKWMQFQSTLLVVSAGFGCNLNFLVDLISNIERGKTTLTCCCCCAFVWSKSKFRFFISSTYSIRLTDRPTISAARAIAKSVNINCLERTHPMEIMMS